VRPRRAEVGIQVVLGMIRSWLSGVGRVRVRENELAELLWCALMLVGFPLVGLLIAQAISD
jgi:hypothetical protein